MNILFHGVHRIVAQHGAAGPDNNWVSLTFPGSDVSRSEITMFFDSDEPAARAYADAINRVPAKMPIDEQVAA